jgi:hypothetical protein
MWDSGVDWIELAQKMDKWRARVKMVLINHLIS